MTIQEWCDKWVDADGPHGNEKQYFKKDPVYKLYRVIADDESRLAAAHMETHSCIAFDRTGKPQVIDQARLNLARDEIERLTGILGTNRRCMERLNDLMKDQAVPFLRAVERQARTPEMEEMARKAKVILSEAKSL